MSNKAKEESSDNEYYSDDEDEPQGRKSGKGREVDPENVNEDWLGSSDEDEKSLVDAEHNLVAQGDEFVDDLNEIVDHDAVVDLEAEGIDFDEVFDHAKQIVTVLQNIKELGDPKITRQDYLASLKHDLRRLFGYNEFLMDKIVSLLPIDEVIPFVQANENRRPVVIRCNTHKCRRKALENSLGKRGAQVEALEWSKIGIHVIASNVPVGATPEYLAGYYMLQSPSSFLPVMALNPQKDMRILDMCAAPGGKTTHLAQLMGDTGVIVANDVNKARTNALIANIHRLGFTNCIVTNCDGRAFPRTMGGFDQVLIDAPCSGTGVIARDHSVKTTKSAADLHDLTHNQKELVLHAYDSVKNSGGKLCYCTCSLLVEENEAVVDYLIKNRNCKVIIPDNINKEFFDSLSPGILKDGSNTYHPSIKNSRRIYPHRENMDGFYFALIDVPQHEPYPQQDLQPQVPDPRSKNPNKKKHNKKFSRKYGGH